MCAIHPSNAIRRPHRHPKGTPCDRVDETGDVREVQLGDGQAFTTGSSRFVPDLQIQVQEMDALVDLMPQDAGLGGRCVQDEFITDEEHEPQASVLRAQVPIQQDLTPGRMELDLRGRRCITVRQGPDQGTLLEAPFRVDARRWSVLTEVGVKIVGSVRALEAVPTLELRHGQGGDMVRVRRPR